ncbi:MAG: hypothetical protein PUG66_01990 [Clostridiales bacterium]|nr:hypothetical protein [Eubacterium sp.]MDD5993236.1 hypothetical protein [Clostridiales bacterium]MDD7348614.1 hypothetical protein [Clostridiales bacterium]MDY3773902.1 hypothetical protein [Eubacterium sp.]
MKTRPKERKEPERGRTVEDETTIYELDLECLQGRCSSSRQEKEKNE